VFTVVFIALYVFSVNVHVNVMWEYACMNLYAWICVWVREVVCGCIYTWMCAWGCVYI